VAAKIIAADICFGLNNHARRSTPLFLDVHQSFSQQFAGDIQRRTAEKITVQTVAAGHQWSL
jgi:hypothetical protein